MAEFHYSLGLDIGIGSVGWAIMRNNAEGEPEKIENVGVRIFDKAEQPKTGESLAAPRREARGARRRIRRHRHRLERIRLLMEQRGIISRRAVEAMYEKGGFEKMPIQLRSEGLDRLLTNEEMARVLIHLAQRRGYQSNSTAEAAKDEKETGKVKEALQENMIRMAKGGYRSIGEMMWKDETFWQKNPDGSLIHQTRNKADDYRFTVARAEVRKEIAAIFAAQRKLGATWATEEIEQAYTEIWGSQRSFDEGPGGSSPYRGGIAEKVGVCTFEKNPPEPRAAKATYTFEYFKLLNDISRLRLTDTTGSYSLTKEQKEVLLSAAMQMASLSYSQLRKKLGVDDTLHFNGLQYGDKTIEEVEKKKWPQMQSYHKMRTALDKIAKGAITTLTHQQLDEIASVLTCYKSDSKRIERFAEIGVPQEYWEALLPLTFSKFGSLSLKAMQKLLPLLEKGERYDEAATEIYGDHRGLSGNTKKTRLSIEDMEPIANPVVNRAVSQTIKVINAVVNRYGSPDVVRIELAREMGQNFAERNKAVKRQEENYKRNERAREQISEVKGDRATGLDIVKFKLFQEQDGVCLYSGKNMDISKLYEPGYVDVDHIIPYSRCFDDSYRNKVLVLSSENRQKGNRLPYEYFGKDEQRWHEYEVRVESRIRDYRKRQKLLKKKFTEEESNEFIARNLKDTQYITRVIHGFLRENMAFAHSKYEKLPVQAVNGAVTSMLRGRWGITKIREDGDLHHCLDAAVVACTGPGLIKNLTEYSKRRECKYLIDHTTGEVLTKQAFDEKYSDMFPSPWPRFRDELEARLDPVDPNKAIASLALPTYDPDETVLPVFASRMPNHKVTGSAHAETVRSAKVPGCVVTKTSLTSLKLDKNGEIADYYNPASDRLLYEALKKQLMLYDGNGEKAFAKPFYKPKADGTQGPLVSKVKLVQKSSLNTPVCGGVAANGDMLRIDVFYIENDGYYFVPIYVADTKKEKLPNKAAVAAKPYEQWKEMENKDFIFSLYPGDLVRIQSEKNIKLNQAKGGTGQQTLIRKDHLYYYRSACISTASVYLETHDRRYFQPSQGIKTLNSLEKYQVDMLGEYHKVTLPEKRMTFGKER